MLQGKKVVFTGRLDNLTRAQAQELVRQAGGAIATSVTKTTDIAVVGADAGAKLDKAEASGLEIWSESDFLKAVGSPGQPAEPRPRTTVTQGSNLVASGKTRARQVARKTKKTNKNRDTALGTSSNNKTSSGARGRAHNPRGIRGPDQQADLDATKDAAIMYAYLEYVDPVANHYKFYQLELRPGNVVCSRWGPIGNSRPVNKCKPFKTLAEAEDEFARLFRQKTGNTWGEDFFRLPQKYDWLGS
jgi:predicted DNA-binding WGR domain protein